MTGDDRLIKVFRKLLNHFEGFFLIVSRVCKCKRYAMKTIEIEAELREHPCYPIAQAKRVNEQC